MAEPAVLPGADLASLPPPGARRPRGPMDRFIDGIVLVAAIFVGLVAADIFVSVLLRYFSPGRFRTCSSAGCSSAFSSSAHLLGTHITVDLLWANANPRWQRYIDVFATSVLLFVVTVQTYTLFDKVVGTYRDNVLTFELHLPTWPFFAVAWAGDVSAVLLIAVRTYRLIFRPDLMADGYQIRPVE